MSARLRHLFSFPDPVNDLAALVVATGVVVMAVVAVAVPEPWLLVVITYGFWARALTGPKLSPLGQLATRVVAPRLGASSPPAHPSDLLRGWGPPSPLRRCCCGLYGTKTPASRAVLGLMIVAASLEAFAGYCIGCKVFGLDAAGPHP